MGERAVIESIELEESITVKEVPHDVLEIYRPRVGDFLALKKRRFNVADLLFQPSDEMIAAASKADEAGSEEMTISGTDFARMQRQVYTHVDTLVALLALCSEWTEAHLRQLTPADMLAAYGALVPLLGS